MPIVIVDRQDSAAGNGDTRLVKPIPILLIESERDYVRIARDVTKIALELDRSLETWSRNGADKRKGRIPPSWDEQTGPCRHAALRQSLLGQRAPELYTR